MVSPGRVLEAWWHLCVSLTCIQWLWVMSAPSLLLQLHEAYSRVCRQQQMAAVAHSECLSLATLLESRGILALKKAKEARLTKVPLQTMLLFPHGQAPKGAAAEGAWL